MPDLGNSSVFNQADASNASGTMPSWSGAAAPSTLDDAGRALQGAVTREWNWRSYTLTAGGTADAKTLTYSVAPAAYYNGQRFAFIANTTNTTSATLNVNGLGAKTIKSMATGTLTNLSASNMVAGEYVEVAYNLANDCFVWVNQSDILPQALGTGDSPQFAGVNIGNASDTTISRSAAGVLAVEGGVIPKENRANTFTANQEVTGDVLQTWAASMDRFLGSKYFTSYELGLHLLEATRETRIVSKAADSTGLISFYTGVTPSERMRIDSSGNVSIGTSVVASNTLRYFDLQNIDTGASAGAIMRLVTSNAAGSGITTVDFVKYKNGSFYLNNNETGASGLIGFSVGGTERLRITDNGGVSFGSSGTAYGTTGQVLVSQGNAPPVWRNPGAVLLGTLTTTSGTTQTLSSLVLTPYKFLRLVFNGVSGSGTGTFSFGTFQVSQANAGADAWIGIVDIDLATGIGSANLGEAAGASTPRVGSTGYTTASTSVSLTIGTGNFDAGSVAVYGVA